MANAVYPLYKQALIDASSGVDLNDGDVRVILVDTGNYTYSAAHDMLDDVGASARVAVSTALQNTTVTNGVFDADDITVTAVSGASVEALIIYLHTGTENTSRLVAYIDTGVTGLPLTPNGADVDIVWDGGANKIFAL